MTQLEAVLGQDPEAAGAHYPLAMAYRGLGDVKNAETHLRQREDHEILPADPLMVELDELMESPQAYESRGIRALNQKEWAEAATLFRKGLALAPGTAALRHRLGTALYMMGEVASAREQFEAAVRVSPDYHLAQYSLGVLLQAEGRHAEAIERFTAARSRGPATPRRACGSPPASGKSGAPPRRCRTTSKHPAATRSHRGAVRPGDRVRSARRYREARARLVDAVKVYPDQSVFAHGLARVLAAAPDDRVRDGQRAMALVQEVLKQGRTLDLGATMAMAWRNSGSSRRRWRSSAI